MTGVNAKVIENLFVVKLTIDLYHSAGSRHAIISILLRSIETVHRIEAILKFN